MLRLPWKQNEEQRIRLLFGTTGSGKTWKLRELLARYNRVFLFDLMADPKLANWGILVDNLEDGMRLALKQPKYRVRMQFDSMETFDRLCYFHVKKPHGMEVFNNSLIAVDELAFFCSS